MTQPGCPPHLLLSLSLQQSALISHMRTPMPNAVILSALGRKPT